LENGNPRPFENLPGVYMTEVLQLRLLNVKMIMKRPQKVIATCEGDGFPK